MNRSELVAALSERAEVTRKDADAVLAAFAEVVGEVVAKGDEKVTIPGFLTFERTHRAARTARSPRGDRPRSFQQVDQTVTSSSLGSSTWAPRSRSFSMKFS